MTEGPFERKLNERIERVEFLVAPCGQVLMLHRPDCCLCAALVEVPSV